MTLPLRVLGDRILVRPDVDDRAPEQQGAVFVAKSLAAAVTGSDAVTSVSRGTVMAVGRPRHPLHDVAEDLARRLLKAAGILTIPWIVDLARDAAKFLLDVTRRQPCCAIGDDVLFAYDAGQRIDLEHDTFIILHEADLFAIVEPEREVA